MALESSARRLRRQRVRSHFDRRKPERACSLCGAIDSERCWIRWNHRRKRLGFSLVEVVIAVGIFAVAITSVIALLPIFVRQTGESAESLVAQRLPDAVRLEFQRVAAAGGFDPLATVLPVMAAPLENGFALVATRDGARLHTLSYLPPAADAVIPESEQFFSVEAWRFGQPPLSYNAASSALVAYIRVTWPYRIPGGTDVTPLADRSQFTFTIAINR